MMTSNPSPVHTAWIGFATLAFSMGIGRFAFTPILPIMQAEGLVSIGEGGLLASVHFVGYAMGAWLAGRLTSSPRTLLFASLISIALSTIAMGLTNINAVWLLARWIAGLCSAFVLVIVSTYVVKHLAELGRADLQGGVFAGVGGGTALAGFACLGMMALATASWLIWLLLGLATLAAAAVLFATIGGRLFERANDAGTDGNRRASLAWHLVIPYGAMGAGYIIPATYLPIMAQQSISSPLLFGWVWPAFGTAAALSTLIAARLHKSYSNRQIWTASQLVMAFGLILPALWPQIVFVTIGGLCVGGTFMVITMAGLKEAHQITGAASTQHQIAAMTTAFALGQIIGPLLAGWAYDIMQSFTYPLLLGGIILVISLAPMLTSTETSDRPIA